MLLLLSWALLLLELAVVARLVAGWLGANPNHPIVKALHTVTQPLFELVKPLARKIPGPFDWTPVIVLIGLSLLRRLVG